MKITIGSKRLTLTPAVASVIKMDDELRTHQEQDRLIREGKQC